MDEERILVKFKELESYLDEFEKVKPSNLEDYGRSIKDRRACERLLQISIECVLDVCNILVSKLKSGMPADEDDVLDKLGDKKIITKEMKNILHGMKGMRNILVHKYGEVDNGTVFEMISEKLGDFDKFKEEILKFLNCEQP